MGDLEEYKKLYYANSYYIRYLVYLKGNNYSEIEEKQREQWKKPGAADACKLLGRRWLSKCCEGVKYKDNKKDEDKTGEELPIVTKKFVDVFCSFFSIKPEEAFLDKNKTDEERRKSHDREYWEKKRKELRDKRDKMIEDEERKNREKFLAGPEAEMKRLEELLVTVLKVCNVGYLSRVYEYLADMLQPQTRRFWMEMEKLLAGLNLYQGYQEAINAGRIETESGWDYPVRDGFTFQKNEPLDIRILYSLAKRQGISNGEDLAKALSYDGIVVYRSRIYDLKDGVSGTGFQKTLVKHMEEVLHAGWDDMKRESPQFWTEKDDVAVWEAAEEQMRQAVRNIKPEDWIKSADGNDTAAEEDMTEENNMLAEIYLAIKNIIRFSLCCHETERNRELLKELENRMVKQSAEENTKTPAADGLFRRCIQELKEESHPLPELRYKLLMNGMNAELRLKEELKGKSGETVRQRAEENVRQFCRNEACTEEEKEELKTWVIQSLKNRKRAAVFEGFRKIWLQIMEENIRPNPWLHDDKLEITWLDYEESEVPAVLVATIEVRIQLPEELEEMLNPGEIKASLPYENGAGLDDVICQNWSIICDEMDDSFGSELEGWEAELYEEWKENVGFVSNKLCFRDWNIYSVENVEIDRMMKDEGFGNRYDHHVAIGKMSLESYAPELASDEKECYEEGVHLLRRAARRWEKQHTDESLSMEENTGKMI